MIVHQLDDWVLCRIHKKSNDFNSSDQHDQEPEGSTVDEQLEDIHDNNSSSQQPPAPPDMNNQQSDFQPMTAMSMSKSCSLTDLLNNLDCAALSQFLLDGSSDAIAELPAPPSPLIYPNQTLNYNINNNMPHAFESRLDHHDGYVNNYNVNGLRRKRMMACSATSFDDGSSSSSSDFLHVAKKPLLLPSDSRGSGFGGGYCNQQLSETATGFQFQNGNMLSHPFPLNQQLLLNNHLQMQ